MYFPIEKIRADFPILQKKMCNHPLVYLDNAANSQKPSIVLDAERDFYLHKCAAVHRSIHTLSAEATEQMEQVRCQIAYYLNANSKDEIIFTKSSTEAINLVAASYGNAFLEAGETIITTQMEHHSNLLPWYQLAQQKKLTLKIWPLNTKKGLVIEDLFPLIDKNTKLLALSHVSNVLGTVNNVQTIIATVKAICPNIIVVVDGAQAAPHMTIDLQALDCDFYVFSSYKMYGPSGLGVLYGKKRLLQQMPPWQTGGAMVKDVYLHQSEDGVALQPIYEDPPFCFEAGSVNTPAIFGLGAAINYLQNIGLVNIAAYEKSLMEYSLSRLRRVDKLTIYENYAEERIGVIAFNLQGCQPMDVALMLDTRGIAIRSGHHCAAPLLKAFGVDSVCRIGLAIYNTKDEIDCLIDGLQAVKKCFI